MTRNDEATLPEGAFALALLSLPGAGPASLTAALGSRSPREAWFAVVEGAIERPDRRSAHPDPPDYDRSADQLPLLDGPYESAARLVATPRPLVTWREAAGRCDPATLWRSARAGGIGVAWRGDDRYPGRLSADPEAPPIVTWRGEIECLSAPTVAIVGTRHCTPAGGIVAYEMARDLGEAGVCVVSGLALGVDGAAHRGALSAPGNAAVTAGIAASGVDVPYPRRHRDLWERAVARGVVVAETAPGRPAQAWRFPARNRIIAGLADLVVVVESFEAGGSLLTVDSALARGIEVCAVPGPVSSPASAGTNRLLFDGAAPVRHAGDILDALGMGRLVVGRAAGRPPSREVAAPRPLPRVDRQVLEAVGWAPTLLGRIVDRSGIDVGATVAALDRLEQMDLVVAGASWWVRQPRH